MTTASTSTSASPCVLVVDDERNIRRTLEMILGSEGFTVLAAETGEAALETVASSSLPVDAIVLDVRLPGMSGLDVLERLRRDDATRELPIFVISGHASVNDAISAVKLGATDFFEKPLNRERVLVSLRNALDSARARRKLAEVEKERGDRYEMIGRSAPMQRVFHDIEKVAPTRASVLITGESGTGKELVARAIHRLSTRRDAPFVRVNCAAIPRELIESELFGHEKGAFTGAFARKRGVFEQAHGGTLFLDEIGDMDLVAQAKVLRALQSGEISRVGSEHVMHVDVRVLAATNKDLEKAVATSAFRDDLYFRLNVFPMRSPSLRERAEDIPLLVKAFAETFARENGQQVRDVDPVVLQALSSRRWPGNVRELRNVVERMLILAGDRVTIAELPEDPHDNPFGDEEEAPRPATSTIPPPPERTGLENVRSLREVREQSERRHIIDTLRATNWNISRTAVLLGVERTNLHKKIRAYEIRRGEGEETPS